MQDEELRQAGMRLMERIELTMQQVEDLVRGRLDSMSRYVVELGTGLASKILENEIDRRRYNAAPAVLECLRVAAEGEGIVIVFLNPADRALVLSTIDELDATVARRPDVRFEEDSTIPNGACRIETSIGQILHDPRVALDNVVEKIMGELVE
ncbi:MAG: FliH/SctL family protein [Planctomycetota bacterium]